MSLSITEPVPPTFEELLVVVLEDEDFQRLTVVTGGGDPVVVAKLMAFVMSKGAALRAKVEAKRAAEPAPTFQPCASVIRRGPEAEAGETIGEYATRCAADAKAHRSPLRACFNDTWFVVNPSDSPSCASQRWLLTRREDQARDRDLGLVGHTLKAFGDTPANAGVYAPPAEPTPVAPATPPALRATAEAKRAADIAQDKVAPPAPATSLRDAPAPYTNEPINDYVDRCIAHAKDDWKPIRARYAGTLFVVSPDDSTSSAHQRWVYGRQEDQAYIQAHVTPQPGDLVAYKPESGRPLRSGACAYPSALIASVTPPLLVSPDGDMVWSSTVAVEHLECRGPASTAILIAAIQRLAREYVTASSDKQAMIRNYDALLAKAEALHTDLTVRDSMIRSLKAQVEDARSIAHGADTDRDAALAPVAHVEARLATLEAERKDWLGIVDDLKARLALAESSADHFAGVVNDYCKRTEVPDVDYSDAYIMTQWALVGGKHYTSLYGGHDLVMHEAKFLPYLRGLFFRIRNAENLNETLMQVLRTSLGAKS